MDPSTQRPQPPGFECGEYLEEQFDGTPTVIFYCTLPSVSPDTKSDESASSAAPAARLTFACRDRSVGVLERTENNVTNEELEAATDDDVHVDPNFFDAGYTLAGRTGFQVWSATRIMLEALLFPLSGDCDRLQSIQQQLRASPKKTLELGAGVGVVSMCLAASFGSQVLLSDLPTLVENSLLPNLKRNQNHDRLHEVTDEITAPSWLHTASQDLEFLDEEEEQVVVPIGSQGGWASICNIDWTKSLNEQVSSIVPELDFIIASDCVWLKSMLEALLNTVDALFQRNKESRLLLSFQRRDSKDSQMFTNIDAVVESVQSKGWTLECLAWRTALVDGDSTPKEVFLLEISP